MDIHQPTKLRHTRRRMELRIYFLIRHAQKTAEKPRPLLIRLTMDGEMVSEYSSGVYVRPREWSQTDQMVKGRTKAAAELNEQLEHVKTQHREILREMKRLYARGEGRRPSPDLVKLEFTKPGSTSPTLLELFVGYKSHLESMSSTEDERAEKTMARIKKTLKYLEAYDNKEKPIKVIDMTVNWGKAFHIWLQLKPGSGERRMQKDSATKYLSHVRDALNYAIDESMIASNVLDKYRPKRGKGKPVYFLELAHVEKLNQMKTKDAQLEKVLWWAKLMCYTGMDYKDAILYARDRAIYERTGPNGVKIQIARSKGEGQFMCEIPLLDEVIALFEIYPEGPEAPLLADLNRHLKVIQAAIGFTDPDKKLTSKILRKTAGVIFLHEGYPVAAISRFLGHSSTRVTEQHYLKITSDYIDSEMGRVNLRKMERAA